MTPVCAGVIAAGGIGLRLGSGPPKAFRLVGGASLLAHAVRGLAAVVDEIVVAVPAGYDDDATQQLGGVACPVRVVTGGAHRQDSVRAALAALGPAVDFVLVHDAARPFAPPEVGHAVLAALAAGAAAVVPVVPIADSLRERGTGVAVGAVVDRDGLVAVQTPQGFQLALLRRAHSADSAGHTDDAGLVEALGVAITTVAGDPAAFKVTTAFDLRVAELLAGGQ